DIAGDRDNFVVPAGQTITVDGYTVTYVGIEPNAMNRPEYVLDWQAPDGATFQTRNEVYQDGRGQWIQHPVVREHFLRDLYVAVFPSAMSQQQGSQNEVLLQRGQSRELGDGRYVLRFDDYALDVPADEVGLAPEVVDLTVGARLTLTDARTGQTRALRPVYAVTTDRRQEVLPDAASDWGVTVAFVGMQVEQNAIRLVVEGTTVQREEGAVVQAYEQPLISVLWIGTLVLLAGFGLAAYRRASEGRR